MGNDAVNGVGSKRNGEISINYPRDGFFSAEARIRISANRARYRVAARYYA